MRQPLSLPLRMQQAWPPVPSQHCRAHLARRRADGHCLSCGQSHGFVQQRLALTLFRRRVFRRGVGRAARGGGLRLQAHAAAQASAPAAQHSSTAGSRAAGGAGAAHPGAPRAPPAGGPSQTPRPGPACHPRCAPRQPPARRRGRREGREGVVGEGSGQGQREGRARGGSRCRTGGCATASLDPACRAPPGARAGQDCQARAPSGRGHAREGWVRGIAGWSERDKKEQQRQAG